MVWKERVCPLQAPVAFGALKQIVGVPLAGETLANGFANYEQREREGANGN